MRPAAKSRSQTAPKSAGEDVILFVVGGFRFAISAAAVRAASECALPSVAQRILVVISISFQKPRPAELHQRPAIICG